MLPLFSVLKVLPFFIELKSASPLFWRLEVASPVSALKGASPRMRRLEALPLFSAQIRHVLVWNRRVNPYPPATRRLCLCLRRGVEPIAGSINQDFAAFRWRCER